MEFQDTFGFGRDYKMQQETRKEAALLDLMNRTKYEVVQENGQRKFGPPPEWEGDPPQKGSEIFIGKIPRDCYEDEIVPLFGRIGRIYELRLMMDFSGSNRGYAFLMYTKPDHARRAVEELNNYAIRPGKSIGVVKSLDNCRLFVGRIPKDKTRAEIKDAMAHHTDGVVDAIVHSYYRDRSKNRGYAFVEYKNHRAAAMARRKLLPGKIQLWGCDVQVDWADPEPEVDEGTMSKVTVLYVRNLELSASDFEILELFSMGQFTVQKVKKIKDFAFVHYESRRDAEWALNTIRGSDDFGARLAINGARLEVTWAKPVDRQQKPRRSRYSKQQQEIGGHYSPSSTSYSNNNNGSFSTWSSEANMSVHPNLGPQMGANHFDSNNWPRQLEYNNYTPRKQTYPSEVNLFSPPGYQQRSNNGFVSPMAHINYSKLNRVASPVNPLLNSPLMASQFGAYSQFNPVAYPAQYRYAYVQ